MRSWDDIVKVNNDFINEYVKDIFKPGAVLVSYGMRGGGKTHCAVSYSQRLIEGYYPETPKHVILVTNIIFVRKTKTGFETESPPGVYTIHTMRELFPIIMDTFEEYGRKDTLIILLLDEAQNFLLGDMNNIGDMAASMKKFCGIIRKFNLCLWLISPAMRNLGPAFRNFLDADNDPGNVNCTFQKNTIDARRFIAQRHYEIDPRSIVYVRPGFNEPTQLLPVPTSSWTTDPELLQEGQYAYDHLSSADFTIGDFPFHAFVQHISGKSSYEMVSGIKEFYQALESGELDDDTSLRDVEKIRREYQRELAIKLRWKFGMTNVAIADLFDVSRNTIGLWTKDFKPDGVEDDEPKEEEPKKKGKKATVQNKKSKKKGGGVVVQDEVSKDSGDVGDDDPKDGS